MIKRRVCKMILPVIIAAALFLPALIRTNTAHAADGIVIAATFPDPGLREYVEIEFDTDDDGRLSASEISEATALSLSYLQVKSLQGIEALTNLQALTCAHLNLKQLDVSKNTNLMYLDCSQNSLTSIDVSKNTKLWYLNCGENQLTSLNVSKNTALTCLECYDNKLTSLVTGKNPGLGTVHCANNKLTSVNLADLPNITYLVCAGNPIKSLDLSKAPELYSLRCYNMQLTSLNVSACPDLHELMCFGNNITTLDLSKNKLDKLVCHENPLTNVTIGLDKEAYLPQFYVPLGTQVKLVAPSDLTFQPNYRWEQSIVDTDNWSLCSGTGATTKQLTITIKMTFADKDFRCLLSDSEGNVATRLKFTLTPAPYVYDWSSTNNPTIGSKYEVKVKVTGKQPLSYQWQVRTATSTAGYKNGSAASAKTPTFGFTVQAGHNNNMFRCIITDADGITYTTFDNAQPFRLNIVPGFTKQPSDVTIVEGQTAKFSVTAKGIGALSYRWQAYNPNLQKWVYSNAPGSKTPTLSITASAALQGFKFRCLVTDASGWEVPSDFAVLYISPAITLQPASITIPVGTTASFSVTAKGIGNLSYQWQAYNPTSKKWVNSSSPTAKTPNLSFTTQTGHDGFKFRCIVTDGNGKTRTSIAAELTLRPRIITQPKSVTVSAGNQVKLSISAQGVKSLSYQWQVWNASKNQWQNCTAASAKTANFQFTAQAGHNGKKFRCVLSDANGTKTYSATVTVTVK